VLHSAMTGGSDCSATNDIANMRAKKTRLLWVFVQHLVGHPYFAT
jgi:hypothetical protein